MQKSPVLLEESSASVLANIGLLATDMDGTLTDRGHFTPGLLSRLTDLAAAGITTLIVTGRSAGWVQGLVAYLPIAGAIAENGGVFIPKDTGVPIALVDLPAIDQHRAELGHLFASLQTHFPDLRPAADNTFRLTDWTFDIGHLTPADLDRLAQLCQDQGWGFTYSTVQCHLRPTLQDKGIGLQRVLQQHFPQLTPSQVVTVGDSPNDEGLFDPERFPLSVGVANIAHYADRLRYQPTLITRAAEVHGFTELVRWLLAAHR